MDHWRHGTGDTRSLFGGKNPCDFSIPSGKICKFYWGTGRWRDAQWFFPFSFQRTHFLIPYPLSFIFLTKILQHLNVSLFFNARWIEIRDPGGIWDTATSVSQTCVSNRLPGTSNDWGWPPGGTLELSRPESWKERFSGRVWLSYNNKN